MGYQDVRRPLGNVLQFPFPKKEEETPWKLVSAPLVDFEMSRAQLTFASEEEIPRRTPDDAPRVVYAWHRHEPGFGVRIMRRAAPGLHYLDRHTRFYIARYRGPDGKDVKKTLGNVKDLKYSEASRQAEALRRDARRKRYGLAPLTDTADVALENYITMRERLSKSTIDTYRKRWALLPQSWRGRRMDSISAPDWESLYRRVRADNGHETARSLARVAHAVYERLVAIKAVRDNPMTGLAHSVNLYSAQDPKGRIIPADQLPDVWHWLHTKAHPSVRDYALVGLLTGLRRGVIESLRWDQLDTRTWTYLVTPETRGNKRRQQIPMPLCTYLVKAVFKPRLKDKKRGDCWIIPSTRYADQPMRSIRGSLDAMKTATGCHVSPHDLRRTYATIALAALGDMTMVRRLLTHDLSASQARMATTAGYVITSELDYRRMVEKVGRKIVAEATKKRKSRDEATEADKKPGDRGSGGDRD